MQKHAISVFLLNLTFNVLHVNSLELFVKFTNKFSEKIISTSIFLDFF